MTDSKALIERLRDYGDGDYVQNHHDLIEAADHIEKLEAEVIRLSAGWDAMGVKGQAIIDELRADNARLREALEGVLTGSTDIECGDRVIYAGAVNAVHAALQGTSHEQD